MNEMDEKKTIFQKLLQVKCPEKKRTFSGKKETFPRRRQNDSLNHVPIPLGRRGNFFLRRTGPNSLNEQFPKGDRN
jgi:hypothetical protein